MVTVDFKFRLRVVDLDPCPAAVISLSLAGAQLGWWLPGTLRRISAELGRQRVDTVGPPFVRYLHTAEGVGVEVGYQVQEAVEDAGEVVASGLPGGPAVMALDVVCPDVVEDARSALLAWLSARGFWAASSMREYHRDVSHGGSVHAVDVVMPYRWR
ncbi:hypothetical protein ABZS66_58090 [Dactylosporangium sp. NPDC005572]|uniref:hypothetical protein n=1 Tax=Dactylosporangium sp. NPDC005572 TaxID=3156889 RepID=UPI0033ACCAEC